MNSFIVISCLILYGLTVICFVIPYSSGKKATGIFVGVVLGVVITTSLIDDGHFLAIFLWPVILLFQVIFVTYWLLRKFGKQRAATITATLLSLAVMLLLLEPWISDWIFSKKDVRRILSAHNIQLQDDFKLLENESGGFRDYLETFTIQLSDIDYDKIIEKIRTSPNFKGLMSNDDVYNLTNRVHYDTVDCETEFFFERSYYSRQKMENGTYHFRFQLDKTIKQLSYIGSDE